MRLLLNPSAPSRMRRAVSIGLLVALLAQSLLTPRLAGAASNSLGVTAQVCDYPDQCFNDSDARQAWARANNCQFLEDVCKEPGWRFDRGGGDKGQAAKAPADADASVFGRIWTEVKSAAAGVVDGIDFAYSFIKGFWEGVKHQVSDLVELIVNPVEFAKGLLELGKAFVKDPAGTIKAVGLTLADDVIDTMHRATRCGAWDLGAVLGENISPAVMLKVAGKLNRYAGDLRRAIRDTKVEFGCASFAAGTMVLTPEGVLPVERVRPGLLVLSRDDRRWSEAPQSVTNVFDRIAPGSRVITTEFERYRLTDEHPLWVQGKGWTPAKDVTDDDVLATLSGDVRVHSNAAVPGPLRVHNFSVAATPSYFVGQHGLWVHNAKCSVWSGNALVRGRLIEEFLAKTDYKAWQITDELIDPKTGKPFGARNFPLIDFQLDQRVVSLKTIDTGQKTDRWRQRLMDHIDELASREITVNGKPTVKSLDIRVQPGGYNDAEFLIAYGEDQGITVTVKELDL